MNSMPATTATEHPNEYQPGIPEMLHRRASELAQRAGRLSPHISQLDYEQAKRELTGESELDRQDAVIAFLEAVANPDDAAPVAWSAWTERELDESILRLCDEFPDVRMAACSRALEHCRRSTPRGTRESLLTAMRDTLRLEMQSPRDVHCTAA
jgi:hypothetical protein